MAGVLTEESTVQCGHGGAVATAGNSLLRVDGHPVLTKAGVNRKAIDSSCAIQPATHPDGTKDVKCLTVEAVDGTEATRLQVGGVAVLIKPLSGATSGKLSDVQTKALKVDDVVQTQLKAD